MKTTALLAGIILAGVSFAAGPITSPDILTAISRGWLPAWYTLNDRWWSVSRRELLTYYVYDCIVDSTTGDTWVIRSKRSKRRQLLEGEISADYDAPKAPATIAEIRVCFPTYMPPPTNVTFTPVQ